MFARCRELGINYSRERAFALVPRILNYFRDTIPASARSRRGKLFAPSQKHRVTIIFDLPRKRPVYTLSESVTAVTRIVTENRNSSRGMERVLWADDEIATREREKWGEWNGTEERAAMEGGGGGGT